MRMLRLITLLLAMPALASADIIVARPDVTADQSVGILTVIVPAEVTAAVTLGGYDINLDITPQALAPPDGLQFDMSNNKQAAINGLGSSSPAPGYLLGGGSTGQLVSLNSTEAAISVDDQSLDFFFGETVAAGTYDLLSVNLVVEPTAEGTYTVDVSRIGMFDEYGEPVTTDVRAAGFDVTITPEPTVMALVGVGGALAMLRRRRRNT